jgi:aminomethyltransferase
VAWIDDGVVGQLHQLAAQRVRDLVHRTAPQIGAANAAGKKRVAREETRGGYGDGAGVLGQIEAYAARRVSGSVHDVGLERTPTQRIALFQKLIHVSDFRRGDTEERGLHFHPLIKRQIVAMHQDGSAGVLAKFAEAAYVVDMSMSADDGFDSEPMAAEKFEDAGDFVARVDHERFAADWVSNNRAIALQHSHWNGDVDEPLRNGVEGGHGVGHKLKVYHCVWRIQERSTRWQALTLLSCSGRGRMETEETSSALETPLAPLHRSAGATMGTWFGCTLPDHWIDPREEEEFARKSVALVDKNYRAYLSFTGPDRVRYLNAILTNNIKDLSPGQGNASLMLNPQGHILAEIETYALAESLFCVSYAMIRERLIEAIEKYIIMDDVTLADESQRYGTLAIEGPKAASVAREIAGVDLSTFAELERGEIAVASIPCWITKRSPGGVAGCEFLYEREKLAELWQVLLAGVRKHGGGPMGYAALSAQRLAQGVPWFGYDFGEKQIPHEAGLQDSHISYTKGCYTGQEIVERVRSRGQVNRRRVDLIFDGPGIPAAGETLTVDGKEAGYVTRAAIPSFLSHAIGMGYVRKDHNALGNHLNWSEGTVVVSRFPDAFVENRAAK